jgi:hypothetical protein
VDLYEQHTRNIIWGNGIFGWNMCFSSENHAKLEVKKNSVIGGRIFIIYALIACKLEYEITSISNILKYTYKWFAEKGILGVKYVFFSENHVKLEMTNNSVIVGRIFLI